jgi:hypothetical protein
MTRGILAACALLSKEEFAATFPSLGEALKSPTADARGAEGD